MNKSINCASVGYRIKEVRESINMTQEKLASILGCTAKHVGAIERGIKLPSLDTFVKIVCALHTSSDILLQDIILSQDSDMYTREFSAIIKDLTPNEIQRILKIVKIMSEMKEI